jgi:hypothetical protein
MSLTRKRKIWSLKEELITKSREAMLCAVQTFNNPNVQFKSETFIVLINISWTYLLHAYFRNHKIDYRYGKQNGKRMKYDRTARGAFKYWELERCLNHNGLPIDPVTSANLRFLIGLRHEIEHQMTTNIDDYLSARFQACCLNYNTYIKHLLGKHYGIDKHLSFSLQFSSINTEQVQRLQAIDDLPANISSFITAFDQNLTDDQFNDVRYSYRVFYVPKIANHKGQADRVIEFIKADSDEAKALNKEYVVIKDREKPKHRVRYVVDLMKKSGFTKFGTFQHTSLWRTLNAKDPAKGFGISIEGTWYWYDAWVVTVENHCKDNEHIYK